MYNFIIMKSYMGEICTGIRSVNTNCCDLVQRFKLPRLLEMTQFSNVLFKSCTTCMQDNAFDVCLSPNKNLPLRGRSLFWINTSISGIILYIYYICKDIIQSNLSSICNLQFQKVGLIGYLYLSIWQVLQCQNCLREQQTPMPTCISKQWKDQIETL